MRAARGFVRHPWVGALAVTAAGLIGAACGSGTPNAGPTTVATSTTVVTTTTPATVPATGPGTGQGTPGQTGSPGIPTGTAQTGGASPCTSAHLTVAAGPAQGAAGTQIVPLTFTNTGTTTCTLQGYPGVSVVGDGGVQIGPAATRAAGQPEPLVSLGPGQSTTTSFSHLEPGANGCPVVGARGFRVYPPGQTAALFAPDPTLQVCSPTQPEPSFISPLQ